MTYSKKKTYFETRYSLKKLCEFRNLVIDYFNTVGKTDMLTDLTENNKVQTIRSTINRNSPTIEKIISEANINTVFVHRDDPLVGAQTTRLCLLNNLFLLHQFDIGPQQIIDLIDKVIGVYSDDVIPSIIRTVNPFFWFMKLLNFIFEIPFYFLKSIGFNTDKIKKIPFIQSISNCIMLLASIIAVLNFLGYEEETQEKIKIFIDYITSILQ
ncbi:MAG: hypothetical protein OXH36_04105 [Bdellovibrionales bacterium]|nr:hypothetical protein [Bdellovibrionales bacterium]